jgi:hypothetical protein
MRLLLLVVLVAAPLVRADGPPRDEPERLTIRAGEAIALCKTGRATCPAVGTCDDTAVAAPDGSPDGLVLRGVAPGTTLCSAASASGAGPRRVFRVTVVAR